MLHKRKQKGKNASEKQVAVCYHNIIMQKRSYGKIVFIVY